MSAYALRIASRLGDGVGLHRAKTGSKALAEVGKMEEEHPLCKRKCYFMRSNDRFGLNGIIRKKWVESDAFPSGECKLNCVSKEIKY